MKVKIIKLKCKRCGHEWIPRKEKVIICAGCHSPYWNKTNYKRRYISKGMVEPGESFTQKHKDNLSKAHTGIPFSQKHKDAISKGMLEKRKKRNKGGQYSNKNDEAKM